VTQTPRFSGRTVLVTGGASGIGQAIAVRLASEGAAIVAFDTNEAGLRETVEKVAASAAAGGRARALTGSVASEADAKRAVAIARALAQDPEAILYDEPTTMVDPLMAAHTGDLILRLKEKFHKTSVVVTHDTHLAKKLADRIVFLHEGRVAYFGLWDGFAGAPETFLRNFLRQDELTPELDVTS
jgi:phospholipid/cholesterol/gamma-HCH transport system ATP-binding protein